MILDQQERQLITVEHGGFLVWDLETDAMRKIAVADADYLTLAPGRGDHFAVVHHRRSGGYAVSVRHFSAPDRVLATAVVDGGSATLEGDADAWLMVPRSYGGYDPHGGGGAPYTLLLISGSPAACEVQRMEWFNGDAYDLGYQGMRTPVDVPDEDLVLIPIQRSSEPVIYNVRSREVVGHLELAGRIGNPSLRFRTAHELWADDYDTLLRLDRNGWMKRGQLFLQRAHRGVRQFIGGWAFDRSRSLCAVGRPFSGDVLGVDAETFKVTRRADLGGQPLDVAVLSDGRVFARDWQSGHPLRGELRAVDPSSYGTG